MVSIQIEVSRNIMGCVQIRVSPAKLLELSNCLLDGEDLGNKMRLATLIPGDTKVIVGTARQRPIVPLPEVAPKTCAETKKTDWITRIVPEPTQSRKARLEIGDAIEI